MLKITPLVFILFATLPLVALAEDHTLLIEAELTAASDGNSTPRNSVINIQDNILSSLGTLGDDRNAAQEKLYNDFVEYNKPDVSDEEKAQFYEALSAKKNATNSNVTRKLPTTGNISSIGKRMSALRKASSYTSLSRGNVIKSRRNTRFSLPMIFQQNNDNSGGLLDQRLSGFFSGSLISSKQSETATESGFEGSMRQLTAGADYRINNKTFAGLALSWTNGGVDLEKDGGELKNNTASLFAYASFNIKPNWYIDGTLSTGKRYFDMERAITLTLNGVTSPTVIVNSEPESSFVGVSLRTGYSKHFDNGHNLSALASLNYTTSAINAFCEGSCTNNPLAYSLEVDAQTITSQTVIVGGQWNQAISTQFGVLIPQLSASLVTELETNSDVISASFTNDPNSNNMSFESGNQDLSYVNIKIGVSAILRKGLSGFIQYETQQFVDDYQQYGFTLGARKEL